MMSFLQVGDLIQGRLSNYFLHASHVLFSEKSHTETPTAGIAVSANGRKFTNYPPTLDPTNTRYNVAELTSFDTETPYPSVEINSPPGGSINYTSGTPGMMHFLFVKG